jgi:hypothetical protein
MLTCCTCLAVIADVEAVRQWRWRCPCGGRIGRVVAARGDALVAEFESESEPGRVHVAVATAEGEGLTCSCRGWTSHRRCWHTGALLSLARARAEARTRVRALRERATTEPPP